MDLYDFLEKKLCVYLSGDSQDRDDELT